MRTLSAGVESLEEHPTTTKPKNNILYLEMKEHGKAQAATESVKKQQA